MDIIFATKLQVTRYVLQAGSDVTVVYFAMIFQLVIFAIERVDKSYAFLTGMEKIAKSFAKRN